jgi:sec-independent protein translocase protein TatC
VSEEELRMSFTEHLGELRDRLIRSAIAVAIGVVICYMGSDYIFQALKWPIELLEKEVEGFEVKTDEELKEASAQQADWVFLQAGGTDPQIVGLRIEEGTVVEARVQPGSLENMTWTTLNPFEPIVVKFKIAGYGGLFLALPFILYQLCAFIFPGLHPREKKVARLMLTGCTVLAFFGVLVAYFGVFPFVIPYLADFVPEGVNTQLRMNETIGQIVMALLGFAIAFQFPMVVLILVYVGILTPETLKAYRKIVIVGLAIVSALLTPPDPITMTFMLVPLYLLYECSIWLSYVIVRRSAAPAGT